MLIAVKDIRTPLKAKGILLLTVLYIISPVDLLPDAIPLAGIIDDMAIMPAAVYGAMNFLPSAVRAECEQKAAAVAYRMPIVLGAVTLIVGLWLALIVYGAYSFVKWLF